MSANFTPSLNSYTDLTPFRFWCQKILPLVYDDSLSYYELLCKVVDYLNKTMEDVNLSIEDVEKLHTAYDSLQKYVNDYFDNLDVQEEINNKLDALVEDGTIHDIFNSDVEAILNTASQAAHDAIEAIPSNVTAWLDTHVTPETDVLIDESLTIDGAAADAKTVGLRLNAYVTPEQFGAVGDGTTDDAVALQEALNSELPTLLTKTYGIRSGLTISHDKVVICGEKAVIKALTYVQNCLTIGENPTTGDDAAISGLIQVLWKGGTIDCGDSGFDRGFVFYRTYHSWISDVTVKNCYGTGFFLTGTYGAETFLNNCCVIGKSASYGQVGFTVGANDQRIINCSAVNMRTGFLSDRGAVKFENCTAWVTYDDTWETTIAFDILGTANELIDCVVDTMHTGVKLYNSTTLFKVTNIRWLHNQQVIPSFVGMTLFEGNTENVNVVGNVDGIQIQGYSQSVYLKKNLADKFIIKNAYAIDSTYIEGYGDVVNTAERILALEDDVSDLKSDLDKIVDTRNLFWGAEFVSGKTYYGGAIDSTSYGYFIVPVSNGVTYNFGCRVRFLSSETAGIAGEGGAPVPSQYTASFTGNLYVTVYLSDEWAMCVSDYNASDVGTVQFPRLAPSMLAQEGGDSESLAMSQAGVTNLLDEGFVALDGEGQVTPQNIQGVTVSGGNVLDDGERVYSTLDGHAGEDGYVLVGNGQAVIQYSDSYYSYLIPVKPNSHYTANNPIRYVALFNNFTVTGTTPVYYSSVIGDALSNVTEFDTGNADHAIISVAVAYPPSNFVISKGNTASEDVKITLPEWWMPEADEKPKYVSTTGNLSDGTSLSLLGYKQNLRKGERYVFSGNISTFASITFGFTYDNIFSSSSTPIYNAFIIDDTNITYKTNTENQTPTAQYPHGLTLENNIQFIFEYLSEGNAKITLISNGVMFTQTLTFAKVLISQVVALSTGSTFTDCKLTWTPIDIDKNIWIFGDSYLSYSTTRWAYYLQSYDYAKHALIDGFPGEGSVNARNSLVTLIKFGAPKYIIWCMGMNDGSDTDASTPSTNWTTWRDEMLTICEQNKITPIFATIPNVPSVLNTGKNAWIKSSGYRYIDFAKAVGAETAGSTWYAGMLSPDNVHPSESGAKALFARVLLDFPEIMLED